MALAAQLARAEPKPETPPPSNGVKSPQPSPTPGAASTKSKSTTTSAPASSSHVSTSTSSVRRTSVITPIVHNPVSLPSPSTATTRRQTAPPKVHTAPANHYLAPLFELRNLAGLQELPSGAGSRGSGLLLAAGFALVLLVIAETSFLGLAGSRFGAGGVRAPSKRRPAGKPVAIRRVKLRR